MPNKICLDCSARQEKSAVFCNRCGSPLPVEVHYVDRPAVAYLLGIVAALIAFTVISLITVLRSVSPDSTVDTTHYVQPVSTRPIPHLPNLAQNETRGKVVDVRDGDSLTILGTNGQSIEIRIAGIDSPEKGQAFGKKAGEALATLVLGQEILVQGDKFDESQRRVGKVFLGGTDIGLEQIKNGHAWHFKKDENEQSMEDRRAYAEAEINARASKYSLWSAASPIAPWEFRASGNIPPELAGKILANGSNMTYHWVGCPEFGKISLKKPVVFDTWEEAELAGYTSAGNCKTERPETHEVNAENLGNDLDSEQIEEAIPKPLYSSPLTSPTPDTNHQTYKPTATPYPTPYPTQEYSPQYSPLPPVGSYPYPPSRGESTVRPPDGAPRTVQVRGYFRKDGTYVRPHTRRAPRR